MSMVDCSSTSGKTFPEKKYDISQKLKPQDAIDEILRSGCWDHFLWDKLFWLMLEESLENQLLEYYLFLHVSCKLKEK